MLPSPHRLAVTIAAGVAGLVPLATVASASAPPARSEAAGAVNQLGADLQVQLAAADPTANLVFSPLSIETALAMASAGAAGSTLTEMNDVLGLTIADPHDALGALNDSIIAAAGDSLSIANALWVQDSFPVEPAFVGLLQDSYDAEPHAADFAGDPESARQEVNGWVAEATADRIPELLSPQQVTALTRLLLVNAVYLDADWVSPFEAEDTFPRDFTTGAGADVSVDTMHQQLFADYSAHDGVQAITLPYTSGLEMVVVLPADGGLGAFEQELAAAGGDLATVLGAADTTEVVLSLPTWDIETGASLAGPLVALGMPLAFGDDADFSGITTAEALRIDDVIHQADITVDELGTEASAATAVIMVAGAAPPAEEPISMDVDRPFFFAVRDSATGTVIFQGHVTDPSQTAD